MSKAKAHGKGQGISIGKAGGTLLHYKQLMAAATEGVVVKHAFTPLRSWPAVPHPQQNRITEFTSMPSRGTK
jgi:hypothetical protein